MRRLIDYLESTLVDLNEVLRQLEADAEELEQLKATGGTLDELAKMEEGLVEKIWAIRYLLYRCNSVLEGDFEMVDLLKH